MINYFHCKQSMSIYAGPFGNTLVAMKRILRYLVGNLDKGLVMKPNLAPSIVLEGFCYADWASDPDDRRSTSGFCLFLGSNLIYWQSKKQHIVHVPILRQSIGVLFM